MTLSDENKLIVYIVILSVSCFTDAIVLFTAFQRTYLRNSAVQFVTYSIFLSDCVWSLFRVVLYSIGMYNGHIPSTNQDSRSYSDDHPLFEGLITVIGDRFILLSSIWIMFSVYEMRRLVTKSISRSEERERTLVFYYQLAALGPNILFVVAFCFCVGFGSIQTVNIALRISLYTFVAASVISFVYVVYTMIQMHRLKEKRKGFIDPSAKSVAYRVKVLAFVYLASVMPTMLVTLALDVAVHVFGVADPFGRASIELFFVTNCIFYSNGIFNAFSIGGSVSCCLRCLRPVLPRDVFDQLLESEHQSLDNSSDANVPPLFKPVFVNTDIENSTFLWSNLPNEMTKALSLHDDCIREQLAKYRGYEITTAGDAFELAFHSTIDAISWCIRVQKELLILAWPKELEQFACSKTVRDNFRRVLFRGLRVRMAIHVGDDQIICSVHPTTGKTVYSGLHEMIARDIVNASLGGQILMSQATRAEYMEEIEFTQLPPETRPGEMVLDKDFSINDTSQCHIADLDLNVPMCEIVPNALKHRFVS
ncbi:adenylate cyclase [Thraustotheca clavata]|uniref:Adenylate cyclase n=1 Tax=Thraustotheca clavata TaxID=74557 RepID=A0A1V9ZEK7_9STRA|nr:adenylate cyclase [Thraustotheca clavata]